MSAVKFKITKRLTKPLLKFVVGQPRYVKIVSPIFLGKEMKAKEGDKKREPAHLVEAINLETGEECQVITGAVVKSVLEESYPNQSYVGKGFAICKADKEAGKEYIRYTVDEIEVEAGASETKPKK